MRIEVVQTVEEVRQEQIVGRTVVVIDVLRASSTIVAALHYGFASVFPVETLKQAYDLRAENTVFSGERNCKKIPDFDYNNSPTALGQSDHTGKNLVLTTTNGTRAIQKAARAENVFIGCLLNATACIKEAIARHHDITLYCAGTRQEFALEDGLAAGKMVQVARQLVPSIQLCDLSQAMEACYCQFADNLPAKLQQTTTGKRLVQHQYTEDIVYCSQVDLLKIVPVVRERRILPLPVS
jgi:2-phosphosulfolactate phosphatase